MNDTIALLKRRRSAPPAVMTGPGPTAEELETILGVASRVPDHGKLAPWRFVVFEGDARARAGRVALDDPARGQARARRKPRARTNSAASPARRWSSPSCRAPRRTSRSRNGSRCCRPARSCMNLIVAARALGFAATWLTEWCAYDARFRAAIGLAEHERIAGFIHIGRPRPDRGPPAAAARRDRHRVSLREAPCSTRPQARDRTLLPHDPFKAIVAPRPIGWISTRASDGRVNLAPYSFFNGFSRRRRSSAFRARGCKDSAAFARESGEFVANLATIDLSEPMNATSAPLPRGDNEFAHAGLTMADCRLVAAPRVAESPRRARMQGGRDRRDRIDARGAWSGSVLTLGEVVGLPYR